MAGAGATGTLEREFRRQAREGSRMRALLAALGPRLARHASWLADNGGVWDGIRDSCDPARYNRLAVSLGLDPAAAPPREVFLAGLSTVATYGLAWGLVLRHSSGADREALLDICRMEAFVNRLARRLFRAATHYYRGQSVMETVMLCLGAAGRPMFRSFVSLSSNPSIAAEFASNDDDDSHMVSMVVLAIDARKAQKMGITPAMYSLASDILGLKRSDEGTDRTFPMRFAYELQAHFCARWPPGSESAAVAILTVAPLAPDERRELEGTGLPVLDPGDLSQKA